MNFDDREKKLNSDTMSAIVILERIAWEAEELSLNIDRFYMKWYSKSS